MFLSTEPQRPRVNFLPQAQCLFKPSRLTIRDRKIALAAYNYANSLVGLQRFEEAKALLRETMPVARRVLGESHDLKLRMGWNYALALYRDNGATLDDLHEAVSTLESVARLWTRIFGEAHPETPKVQGALEVAREKLADARAAASNKSKPPL